MSEEKISIWIATEITHDEVRDLFMKEGNKKSKFENKCWADIVYSFKSSSNQTT